MSTLVWEERNYRTGVDRGVLYPRNGVAEVWNGLISVAEKPTDIRERVLYREGRKVANHRAEDSYAATIECFTYPDWLSSARAAFNMSYRVQTAKGYEIHLVYNAFSKVGGGDYSQNDLTPFTVDIFTRPTAMPLSMAPSAHAIVDSSDAYSPVLTVLENMLYGDADNEPRFPSSDELIDIFDDNAILRVVDHGDGTFTVTGPDEMITMLNATTFQITAPSAIYIEDDTYTLKSW